MSSNADVTVSNSAKSPEKTPPSTVVPAEVVAKLRKVFRTGRTRPLEWRKKQLEGLKKFMVERNQELCDAMWKDFRKSKFESTITEQGIVIGEVDYVLPRLEDWMRAEPVETPLVDLPGSCEIRHDPYGVVLIIGAWNYPINLLLAPLVGAIAGGNAVVLKPSELAVETSAVVAKFIPQYLDPEAVVVIEGGVEQTTAILNEQFDHIFFTGSGKVGKIVMGAAAKHLTPVTLELGGKSPAIIMGDADIKVAARRIAWGKFMNAGQTCIAPDYVLIHPSVEQEFLKELKDCIETFYGPDAKKSPDYCRIINDQNFQRLEKLLSITHGEVYMGGGFDASERYIEPTIMRGKLADQPLMQEEIFGPILPVIPVETLDEAIQFVNDRPKPLALYLFTKRNDLRERVLDETSSGGVCLNDVVMHMPVPTLPFGGVGPSGMGNYHGKRSFDTFTHSKGVMKKATWIDPSIRYAPYNDEKLKWLKRLL